MKKAFLLILCLISCFFVTACNDKNEEKKIVDKYEGKSGKVTCVLETGIQTFDFKGTYTITYQDGYVTKIYTREIIELTDQSYNEKYVNALKEKYSKYDGLEYYEYSINKNGNKITNNTMIDYKNIDLDALSTIEEMEKPITKEELKMSTTINSYKIMGAVCEE